LFEEAAGIKKYKLQRKEATKKLNDVLSDLQRVDDLIDEVRKNVNSLQRHAQKTRRYNVLNEEFRTVDTKLSAFQFKNFNTVADILKSEIQTFNEDKIRNEFLMTEKNNFHSKLKTEFQEVDSELNSHLENELEVEKKIGDSRQNIAVSNEKLKRSDGDEIRLKNEIEDINQKLLTTDSDILLTRNKINDFENLVKNISEELQTVNQEVENFRKNTVDARNEVSEFSQNLSSIQTNINTHKSNIHRSSEKKQLLQNKIKLFDSEKNELQEDIEIIDGKLEGSDKKTNDFAKRISEKENFFNEQKTKQNQLQNELDNCKQEISKYKNELHSKKSALDFLHNLVDTSETAKFLLNSNEWSDAPEKLMLSESIAIDEDLQNAISMIFSNYSDYFVTDTKENAQKAISLLKRENKGKAGFICLDTVPTVSAPEPINSEGVIGWFSEIIRADDKIRNAARLIFDRVLVVENSETAQKVFNEN
jgi:chromosome segregation protein